MKKFVPAGTWKTIAILFLIFLGSICVVGQTSALISSPLLQEPGDAAENLVDESVTAVTSEPFIVKVAGESLQFTVTGQWENVPPRSGMLEAELKIPSTGDDEQAGRLTIMGAGGTIEKNIDRWKTQFSQPKGGSTDAKVEEKTLADQKVTLVDIAGTFLDAPGGPFSSQPKIERDNYRMLAAIIETENSGNYFVKLYGPKATIDKNADAFRSMIESLKIVD
jgi:gluconolactonase